MKVAKYYSIELTKKQYALLNYVVYAELEYTNHHPTRLACNRHVLNGIRKAFNNHETSSRRKKKP